MHFCRDVKFIVLPLESISVSKRYFQAEKFKFLRRSKTTNQIDVTNHAKIMFHISFDYLMMFPVPAADALL